MGKRAVSKSKSEVVTRIDLPALRVAADAIRAHRELIVKASRNASSPALWVYPVDIDGVLTALNHILDDEYRSDEMRGGS
jgi:hypothetical protein